MHPPRKRHNKQEVTYSDHIAAEVLARMADGETLTNILKSECMPDNSTWLMWCRERPELALAYNRAQQAMLRTWGDQLIEMADDSAGDYYKMRRKNGEILVFQREHVERAKLRIATRWQLMQTLAPAVFGQGDKRTGGDPSGGALAQSSTRELVQLVATYAQALGFSLPPEAMHRMMSEAGGLDGGGLPPGSQPSPSLPAM